MSKERAWRVVRGGEGAMMGVVEELRGGGGGVYPGREEIWSIIYLLLYVCLCVPRRMWWIRRLLYVLLRAPFEVRRRRCSDPCKGEGDSRRRYDVRSTEYDERSTIRKANPLFNWRISVLSLEDDQEDLANDIICAQYVVMSVCNNEVHLLEEHSPKVIHTHYQAIGTSTLHTLAVDESP